MKSIRCCLWSVWHHCCRYLHFRLRASRPSAAVSLKTLQESIMLSVRSAFCLALSWLASSADLLPESLDDDDRWLPSGSSGQRRGWRDGRRGRRQIRSTHAQGHRAPRHAALLAEHLPVDVPREIFVAMLAELPRQTGGRWIYRNRKSAV
jgi:hypothetical protein